MNPKKIQSVNPDRENFNFYHRKAAENENYWNLKYRFKIKKKTASRGGETLIYSRG